VREALQDETETAIMPRDAYYLQWQGGGGFGDPTLRDPGQVARDLQELRISAGAAREIYGVVLGPGPEEVDAAATEHRRHDIRAGRRESARRPGTPEVAPSAARTNQVRRNGAPRLDENLVIQEQGGHAVVSCAHCGYVLCQYGEDYIQRLAQSDRPTSAAGPQIGADPATYVERPVVFRQYYCPSCFTAFLSLVVPVDHVVGLDVSGEALVRETEEATV
jgi:N-methylhydantoinase B